jgi:hypothetical protein
MRHFHNMRPKTQKLHLHLPNTFTIWGISHKNDLAYKLELEKCRPLYLHLEPKSLMIVLLRKDNTGVRCLCAVTGRRVRPMLKLIPWTSKSLSISSFKNLLLRCISTLKFMALMSTTSNTLTKYPRNSSTWSNSYIKRRKEIRKIRPQ